MAASSDAVVSFGGLTTVTSYHLVPKKESVVDSMFMHERYAPRGGNEAMVVATRTHLYNVGGSDSDE